MIERHEARIVKDPGGRNAPLFSNCHAELDCGCAAHVGYALGETDPSIAVQACGPEHRQVAERFVLLYRESLVEPQPREAVEVADELLLAASRMDP